MRPYSRNALASAALLLAGCGDDDKLTGEAPIQAGKHRYTLQQGALEREYFVHVPAGYSGQSAVPVVFMLHGTNQTGNQFYEISGWKEVGDAEGILTVFPTAVVNCVIEDGKTQTLTKWNSYPDTGGWRYCDGVNPPDDVAFLRSVRDDVLSRFNADARRIYIVGFSNGSEMTARASVDLSDIFAAAVMSSGGGALPDSGAGTPVRLLPVLSEFGTRDEKLLRAIGRTDPLPMDFTRLFTKSPGLYRVVVQPFIRTFELDAEDYTISGDSTAYITADFHGVSGSSDNVWKLVEVKGLEHEYPNTINHPLNGAALHWEWMKQFSLPS